MITAGDGVRSFWGEGIQMVIGKRLTLVVGLVAGICCGVACGQPTLPEGVAAERNVPYV